MSYQALLFCPDEKTARVVTQVLTDLEFSVEPCSEPFAAVKKLMAQHFDAIVVDCENEQNATLLFKSARNSASNQSALAVAVVEGQAGVAKAFRIGANLVLTKPINVEQSKGTLRVARGLLRKADSYKPPVTATPVASRPTAPAAVAPFKPVSSVIHAPAVPPKPAFGGFPTQRASSENAISDKTSSAFELQQDPTPEPEPTEAALLESMSDSIDSKRSAQPATSASASKEYPWQPVSKPLSTPMASALKRAAEAAGKTDAVAPSATKAAPPPANFAEAAKTRPAAYSMPSGHGAASAPAPAREIPRPGDNSFEHKLESAAAKASPTESHQTETEPTLPKISAAAESADEPLMFSAMQAEQKAGGSKQVLVFVAIAIIAIAGAAYYTTQHPEVAPAALQKYLHKQTVPVPIQTQAPVSVQPQASAPARNPVPAPTIVTPAENADQGSALETTNSQPDTTEVSSVPSHPAPGTKPSAAKAAPALAPNAKAASSTPAPAKQVLNVTKSASTVKTPAPSPETVQPLAPSALGVGSGVSDKALAGIATATGSSLPSPPPAEALRISQGVTQGLLIKRVPPMYPPSAKQLHIQGTVQLEETIGQDGNVRNVKALSGDATLARAAIDAVKQWKYKPYTLNSEPVEIQTTITVNFKLP